MISSPPSFLFAALAEFDPAALTRHGLSGQDGEAVLLYEDLEMARQEISPAEARCVLMISTEPMLSEGHILTAAGGGIWRAAVVPPQYLWISEAAG